jgi:hypothetical protein
MGRTIDHFFGATSEPDGQTPSSARIYAGWIFTMILILQLMVISVLCWKILRLETWAPNAPSLGVTYTSVLKTFFTISILFDMGTALSLYGINVWKYIAQIRTGVAVKDDGTDVVSPAPTAAQVMTVVTGKPSEAPDKPSVVPTPKSSDAGDDVSPSRVD